MNENETRSTEKTHTRIVSIRAEIWRAVLEIAGRQIDPETAVVCIMHRQVIDPYGAYPDRSVEHDCIGRLDFAHAPGSLVWIEFGDLPDTTRKALDSKKHISPKLDGEHLEAAEAGPHSKS